MENIENKMIEILDAYEGKKELISNQGQALDGYSALASFLELTKQIRNERNKDKNIIDKKELLIEAVKDWKIGLLTDFQAMLIISNIVFKEKSNRR